MIAAIWDCIVQFLEMRIDQCFCFWCIPIYSEMYVKQDLANRERYQELFMPPRAPHLMPKVSIRIKCLPVAQLAKYSTLFLVFANGWRINTAE